MCSKIFQVLFVSLFLFIVSCSKEDSLSEVNTENILPGLWTIEVQSFQTTRCIDGNNSESNTTKVGTAIFQKDRQVQFAIENEHNHYNWAVDYSNYAPFYCQSNNITLW